MANAIYPKFKAALFTQAANSNLSTGDVKVALIDTADETYDAADEFLSDITGAGIVDTSGNLVSKTFTSGLFDAADPVFAAASGDPSEALLIYIDTGVAATSRLVAWIDTGVTGLPVTPNSGDINIWFNASGIWQM
jgi:hypothetical protein